MHRHDVFFPRVQNETLEHKTELKKCRLVGQLEIVFIF